MKLGYACDNCGRFTVAISWIFLCLHCQKEICEDCMYSWATCKECAAGKTDEFLQAFFESQEEPFDTIDLLTRFLTRTMSRD